MIMREIRWPHALYPAPATWRDQHDWVIGLGITGKHDEIHEALNGPEFWKTEEHGGYSVGVCAKCHGGFIVGKDSNVTDCGAH